VAGAGGLAEISSSPVVLAALRHAYADAVRWTMILAVASICIAFPSSCAMEWLNIKHVAEQRKSEQEHHGTGSVTTSEGVQRDQTEYSKDEEKAVNDVRVIE